jgi:spermidine/putrescine transport system permease protein
VKLPDGKKLWKNVREIPTAARTVHPREFHARGASINPANRFEALRRVLFPMLFPAIFASAVLVFADVIDDFVIVQKLSSGGDTEPVAVKIYNTARGAPTPALNALATLLLLAALIAIVVGYLGYRALTRGEGKASLGSFAGQV